MDSDSPTLPPAYVAQAFTLLDGDADAVFGPCRDGGYYLVGMKRPLPALLREVQMSTPTVLADTLAIAARDGVRVALLPEWYDVDTGEELAHLAYELHTAEPAVAQHSRRKLAMLAWTGGLNGNGLNGNGANGNGANGNGANGNVATRDRADGSRRG
jgi:hypothetical protein